MKHSKKDKYVLEKDVYYMIIDGEKVPVDINASPKFKAFIIDKVVKKATWTS